MFPNIRVLIFSFQTLEFLSYPCNHRIFIFFFQTLQFLFYPSKHWNCYLILRNVRVFILLFQTLEFLSHPSKHWNSYLILPNIRIFILSFQTSGIILFLQALDVLRNSSKHSIGILTLSFQTLQIHYLRILPNIGILILSFQTLESLYPSNSYFIKRIFI